MRACVTNWLVQIFPLCSCTHTHILIRSILMYSTYLFLCFFHLVQHIHTYIYYGIKKKYTQRLRNWTCPRAQRRNKRQMWIRRNWQAASSATTTCLINAHILPKRKKKISLKKKFVFITHFNGVRAA